MSKLNAVKEKLAGLKSQLADKANKIAFFRAWREKRSSTPASDSSPAPSSYSISTIYREGSTFTRLQVILFVFLGAVATVSSASLMVKLASKLKSSSENENLKKDYSNELAEVKRKSMEKVEMLALGQFTTNAYVSDANGAQMMTIDLWIRVSDPETASLVNNRTAAFHEKTMDALNELYMKKVSLLTEQGKKEARQQIRDALGEIMPKGHSVEEVFIQNLVFQ